MNIPPVEIPPVQIASVRADNRIQQLPLPVAQPIATGSVLTDNQRCMYDFYVKPIYNFSQLIADAQSFMALCIAQSRVHRDCRDFQLKKRVYKYELGLARTLFLNS